VPTDAAVVVDRWPLVRLGVAGVLRQEGWSVVAEAAKVGEGLLLQRVRGAGLLVFGSPADGLSASAIRAAKRDDAAPRIVVLISSGTGADVSTLFAAGVDGLVVASTGPAELADVFARVRRGERVVGPSLGPGLVRRDAEDGGGGPPEERGGPLTNKELEVLDLLAKGLSNKQIANALVVSDSTVKTHLQHIYAKLDVQGRHGALSRAVELGLLV
jgi:DNA-binding NarL/FixJ family response regulator